MNRAAKRAKCDAPDVESVEVVVCKTNNPLFFGLIQDVEVPREASSASPSVCPWAP